MENRPTWSWYRGQRTSNLDGEVPAAARTWGVGKKRVTTGKRARLIFTRSCARRYVRGVADRHAACVDLDELVEHWTLLEDDHELVAGKRGATRLGFALLLKFYTRHGRFPVGRGDFTDEVVAFVASQVRRWVRRRPALTAGATGPRGTTKMNRPGFLGGS